MSTVIDKTKQNTNSKQNKELTRKSLVPHTDEQI